MTIIDKSLRFALTLTLPFILLINLLGFVSFSDSNFFINIVPVSMSQLIDNWQNGYFGLTSIFNMIQDIGNFDFSKMLKDLLTFVKLVTAGVGSVVTDWAKMGVIEKIFKLIQTLILLIYAPITTAYQGLVILIDVFSYLVTILSTIGYAIAGFYNIPNVSIDINSGWNSIDEPIYALKNVLLL